VGALRVQSDCVVVQTSAKQHPDLHP